jgi:hypothetical protein
LVQRQELFLVFPTKSKAVRAVQACVPDAEVKIDSEASPSILAEYQVNNGESLFSQTPHGPMAETGLTTERKLDRLSRTRPPLVSG